VHWNAISQALRQNLLANNKWAYQQGKEDDEQDEVDDGISPDTSLSQFGLLHGVNGWADLSTWAKPEEHNGVKLVNLRDGNNGKHDEEDEVTKDKVSSKHSKLSDLAKEFTTRLRNRVPTHRVPFTGPESDVGGVSLQFSGQGQTDNELVDKSLNGGRGNHSQQGLGKVEAFQEEHDLEEDQAHNDGDSMCNSGENRSEFLATHT